MHMPEKNPQPRVSLEDLLRLKRAERPTEAFWAEFEVELRTRQLAAAVDQKRWWFSLPRVFAGFSRYQMPMGAAAVLAVTFLTLRDYREPGIELAVPATANLVVDETPVEAAVEDQAMDVVPSPSTETSIPVAASSAVSPQLTRTAVNREVTPLVPWGTSDTGQAEVAILSPSARSIAANLAAATESQPEWTSVLSAKVVSLGSSNVNRAEPLAQVSSPKEVRRERLFAYSAQPAAMISSSEERTTTGRERLASRLSDEQLYETVSRMNAGGDRLTLTF